MIGICKCGCGGEVSKEGNLYIHGHNHKGKTYEEIYGDLSLNKKYKRSIVMKGKLRPDMLGDNNSAKRPEVRKKIKDGVKKSWERNSKPRLTEISREKIRKTNEESGAWISEQNLGLFELYSRKVKKYTTISIKEKYPKNELKNRGRSKNNDSVDHIFSVQKGFINGVLPRIIGCKSNIRIISKSKNSMKYTKCDISIDELFKLYIEEIPI
jgi:hypothetical protein